MDRIFPQARPARILGTAALVLCLSCAARAQQAQPIQPRIPNTSIPDAPALHATLSNTAVDDAQNESTATARKSNPAGTISLYTVIDLALRNSKKVQIAETDVQRAQAALSESRDVYIPNIAAGSGVGPPSYGFPLGNPTLFNITSNSLVFSFSQRDYIRSARKALKSATLSLQDSRQQIMLDTALDYIGLQNTLQKIAALNQASTDTDKLIAIVNDRMQSGLESPVNLTRAKLTGAQIQLRVLQLQDHADELRNHLSNSTGLTADLLTPIAASIPSFPDLNFASLTQAASTPAIQAARANADAKMYRFFGDKRQNYRPTIGFGFQYARFATFTGYQDYYRNFKYNNVEAGIQMTWPIYDPVRRARAMESKAEADHARRQAELARIESSEGNLTLWHNLRELEAQEKVADLQQQLAQDTLNSTVTQMKGASSGANGAPITPQQAEQSRVNERTSYVDLQDAQFNVTRVKLNLLNAVGELEDWVKDAAALSGSR
jgi:outer membrane protein TolC